MKNKFSIAFLVLFLSGVSLRAQMATQIHQMAHADSLHMVDMYKDLHQNPELGFMEIRTSGIIARELKALGYEVITGIGKTVCDYIWVGTAHPDAYAKAVSEESGHRIIITMEITRLIWQLFHWVRKLA